MTLRPSLNKKYFSNPPLLLQTLSKHVGADNKHLDKLIFSLHEEAKVISFFHGVNAVPVKCVYCHFMKERNNKHTQTCYEPVQESSKSLKTIERKVNKKMNNIHEFEYFVCCVSVQKAARSCSCWNKMSHLSDP